MVAHRWKFLLSTEGYPCIPFWRPRSGWTFKPIIMNFGHKKPEWSLYRWWKAYYTFVSWTVSTWSTLHLHQHARDCYFTVRAGEHNYTEHTYSTHIHTYTRDRQTDRHTRRIATAIARNTTPAKNPMQYFALLTWLMPCRFQWNIGHRPPMSIQFCLVPPPPSFSSCTSNLLPTRLSFPVILDRSLPPCTCGVRCLPYAR